jgi:hypothetical protein
MSSKRLIRQPKGSEQALNPFIHPQFHNDPAPPMLRRPGTSDPSFG